MTDQLRSASENNGHPFSFKSSDLAQHSSRRSFMRRSITTTAVVAPVVLLAACGQATTTGNSGHTPTTTTGNTPTSAPGLIMPSLSDTKAAFNEIMNDEVAHVQFLKTALTKAGVTPRPKPT